MTDLLLNVNRSSLAEDRVGCMGLRPATLPHHRTCGFPHPAVEPSRLRVRQDLREGESRSGAVRCCLMPGVVPAGRPLAKRRDDWSLRLTLCPEAPAGAGCATALCGRAISTRSTFGYVDGPNPPVRKGGSAPRPVGNIPTSLGCSGSNHPAIAYSCHCGDRSISREPSS